MATEFIHQLPPASLPLSGSEAVPIDVSQGGGTFVTQRTTTGAIALSLATGLVPNEAVATDGTAALVSVPNTGSGSNVLANGPTLVTPHLGAATGTSLQLSALSPSAAVATDTGKNLVSVTNTGTGNNVLAVGPTVTLPNATGLPLATGVTGLLQYVNGGRAQTGHPLRMDRMELCRAPGEHFWNGPIVYDPVRFRWWHFFTSTWHHGPSTGAGLQVHWSEDGFQHDDNPQDILTVADFEYNASFGAATVYPSGRVGIVVFGRGVSTSQMIHAYTDDGENWVIVDISPPIAVVLVGVMQDLPNGNKVAYGYGSPRGKEEPIWLSIANEGTSPSDFDSGTCFASVPAVDLAEPTVFKVSANQWGMLCRNDASDTTTSFNAFGSVSTDGQVFSAPLDSGMRLGFNPVTGIVDDNGYLWGYSVFRGPFQDPGDPGYAGTEPGYASPIPAGDSLGVIRTLALSFFSANGVFPVGDRVWVAVDQMPARNTGSIYYCRDLMGNYYATCGAQEILLVNGDPAAEMMIILFSPTKPIIPRQVAYAPCANEIDNPYFRQRSALAGTLAATGPAIGGIQITDRWFWDGHTVSTAAITFPDIDEDVRRLVPGRPNTGLGISAAGGQFVNINQIRPGKSAVQRYSDRTGWFQLYLQGTIPATMFFQVTFNFGSGGSTSVSANTALGIQPAVDGIYHMRRKILFPSTYGMSWGTSPYVAFRLIDVGVTDNTWDCTLIAAKLGLSPDIDPIIRPYEEEEDFVLNRYLEYVQFSASQFVGTGYSQTVNITSVPLNYQPKVVVPAPAVRTPTAGDFLVNGVASDNATSLTQPSKTMATLKINATAFVNTPQNVVTSASAPPLIVISTGY